MVRGLTFYSYEVRAYNLVLINNNLAKSEKRVGFTVSVSRIK